MDKNYDQREDLHATRPVSLKPTLIQNSDGLIISITFPSNRQAHPGSAVYSRGGAVAAQDTSVRTPLFGERGSEHIFPKELIASFATPYSAPRSLRESKAALKLTDVQFAQQLREKARELHRLFHEGLPQTRETALAKTKLEEALLWAEVAVRA
jgi:hypothetical protein